MVLGYHTIFTGYGHWLPIDPRGSLSRKVYIPGIAALGEHHVGRVEKEPSPEEMHEFYARAAKQLAFPILWWSDAKRQALADALGEVVRGEGLTCYSAAILSDHVHLLLRRNRLRVEQMVEALIEHAQRMMIEAEFAPEGHPVFSTIRFHLYKSSLMGMTGSAKYIWDNYAKHGLEPCTADWLTEFVL